MNTRHSPASEDVQAIRQLIEQFLHERLSDKLDKLPPDDVDRRQSLIESYQPEAWLASAARRVSQIQLVNFGLKFTHPDARGTNLYLKEADARPKDLVGTHTLGQTRDDDVVGNAAALDVYKLLKLTHDKKTLLQRAIDGDAALRAALSDDDATADDWMRAFASITQSGGGASSHTLAKQVYFPLPEGGYHLLAPLFPTSLVHRVYTTIQTDRFSDASKSARQAFREQQPWSSGFCEYPNLAMQKVGGTKPQNISQLNSERRGEVYLLPSCPPSWQRTGVKPPVRVTTVFAGMFPRRRSVSNLTKALREFLARTDYNNWRIRQTRKGLVADICDQVLQFAAEIQRLPSGWSAATDCRLDAVEALWLDPGRATTDEPFASARERGDWKDEICSRFGKWLNMAIQTRRTRMGDPEYQQWQSDLDDELRIVREEIGDE